MKYIVVVEPTETGYSGYLPDIAGCVASAPTKELLMHYLKEGVHLHLEASADESIKTPVALCETMLLEID